MLAQKLRLSLPVAFVLTLSVLNSSAFAQTTPSQRYQPVRNGFAPPSVHVSPQNIKQLPNRDLTSKKPTSLYRFSDEDPSSDLNYLSPPKSAQSKRRRGDVQQTSFQVETKDALASPPIASSQTTSATATKKPADFAAAMQQARNHAPTIGGNKLAGTPKAKLQNPTSVDGISFEPPAETPADKNDFRAGELTTQQQRARINAPQSVNQEKRLIKLTPLQPVEPVANLSASEFIDPISVGDPAPKTKVEPTDINSTKLIALQSGKFPPASKSNNQNKTAIETQLRTLPAYSQTINGMKPVIHLRAPALEVDTYGPKSVGINKLSDYQVVVKNNSNIQAERILVGINIPSWVEIENVNLSTGKKELTDGKNQARLVWNIDKIAANSSQTMTISAIPRKPQVFDVGVEWTLIPRIGSTNVNVTEPRLKMSIAGPPEVLYGETAIYHVSVRNPGTGTAEDVVVMLPEALGGERASLGLIEAGQEKNFQVELLARTAGKLNLVAKAAAEGDLQVSAERELVVRRAQLKIAIKGPGLKYSGSGAQYTVSVTNTGDATANNIISAIALPNGVEYLSGVESVKLIEGGLRWSVGTLDAGQSRTFKVNCLLETSGDLQLEVGARGQGDLAASDACVTKVETIADLVLSVADPKGPLPTGEDVPYEIKVQNRGSRTAVGVKLVMQFSEGIEPKDAKGLKHQLTDGQVLFSPIEKISPGEEMTVNIIAEALKAGTHIFRAQLICEESDSREVAEGTTRFFGETIQPTASPIASEAKPAALGSNDFQTQRK
jgi:uncharacterized repeat protein (TIGR01451 family)